MKKMKEEVKEKVIIKDIRPERRVCTCCKREKGKSLFHTVIKNVLSENKQFKTTIKKLTPRCKACDTALKTLKSRTLKEWKLIISKVAVNNLIQKHIACIVWWDFRKPRQEWRAFLEENKCFSLGYDAQIGRAHV